MPDIREPHFSYPRSAVMFHRYATVLVGNALTCPHDSAADWAHISYQSVSADGDTFTHSFYLAAGIYSLNVLGVTGPLLGKIDWYLDNLLAVSGQDWYSAGWVLNVVQTTVVTVIGNGLHTLKGIVNGRNVASIDWYIQLTAMSLL